MRTDNLRKHLGIETSIAERDDSEVVQVGGVAVTSGSQQGETAQISPDDVRPALCSDPWANVVLATTCSQGQLFCTPLKR